MTKANKTIIKDKILDLREKIQKQSMDLHEQVKKKKDRYHDIFEESNDKSESCLNVPPIDFMVRNICSSISSFAFLGLLKSPLPMPENL